MADLRKLAEELLSQATKETADLLRILKDEYGIFPSGDRLFERKPDENMVSPKKTSRRERREQTRQEKKKKCKKRG